MKNWKGLLPQLLFVCAIASGTFVEADSITPSAWGGDAQGQITASIGAGNSAVIVLHKGHATVSAQPGGGGTMAVQYATSSPASNCAGAVWQNWPDGTVSATTTETLVNPVTCLKASATTAAGTLEVVQHD